MKKYIKRSSTPFIEGFDGLVYCKKALYYNDGEAAHQITNILNDARPFSKLIVPLQDFTRISFTDPWVSQDYLDKGVAPDMITINSILVQPRVGYLRLWKNSATGDIYIEFLDTYNGNTVGRPTDKICKAEPYKGGVWDESLKFPLNFYRSDMSQEYATRLFQGYLNNSGWQNGTLKYRNEVLNLQYLDMTMSWYRIVEPNYVNPYTVVCIDDGYTGRNWKSIKKPSTSAQWNGSIMADRFMTRFEDSATHWYRIQQSEYFQGNIEIIGHTEISLGLGDVKLIIEEFENNCSLSFSSKNDLANRNILLNCKLIAGTTVRQFNPVYEINNNVYFTGNAKIEILASGSFATKQEVFVDNGNKNLILISQQLF